MSSGRLWLGLKRSDDQNSFDWVFNLGSKEGSKSTILKLIDQENVKFKVLYDFQHRKEHFDDFKQNLVLRILDGRIQIFHDLVGTEYFPSEYVIDSSIKKASFKFLKVLSIYGYTTAQNWTIQRVEINSG